MESMERELKVGISLERTSDSIGSRWRERLGGAVGAEDSARVLIDSLLRALEEDRHCLRLLNAALGYGQACFAEGRTPTTLHRRLDTLGDTLAELSVSVTEDEGTAERTVSRPSATRLASRIQVARV